MDAKDLKREWQVFLAMNGLKNPDVAKQIGITNSALWQRINNGSLKYIDFVNILDAYGYTLRLEKKN